MELNIIELLIAFAGGIFGAAIGAFPVWVLCGLAVLIGATVNLTSGNPDFMNLVAWGIFLGPHTSFAGGCAAAAFAAKKKLITNGRDICTALVGLNNPSVLLVGGLFGILGHLILLIINLIPNYSDTTWTNTIALAVILNMFITRLVYGNTGLLGKKEGKTNRWIPTNEHSWVIYQSDSLQILLLAIAIGSPAAYMAIILPGSSGLIFGFATVAYTFMIMGYKIPVTHHIALSSSMVTATTGNIAWGIAFGILAAYIGELCAAAFVYHGDTHIDPPTMALVITFTIYPALEYIGVFEYNGIFTWIVPIVVATGGFVTLNQLRKIKEY
ncbi:hypothetical protein [uncultured Bacteroides sp.]|uniref:hypothetical protein n=1 Tax=uncultured Bacteroides sp. TaxID=162156 RepID=UPI0026247098|nr:hypothetical protein [uncultured Bacteroides sp.]